MFKNNFFLLAIFLLTFLKYKIVLASKSGITELKLSHESYISSKGFGIRQELDEDLCQLQNNLTTNTLVFADATGKFPSGILNGNLYHFGQYEQCLSVDETVEEVKIRGKYCMMQLTLDIGENVPESSLTGTFELMSTSGLFGVCVPNACEATFVDLYFDGINITSEELYCREANDKPMAPHDIVAIVVFSTLGLLVILSTCYHLTYKILFNKDVSKIAKSFSIHHNMTRLTNIPKSGNPLSCINGIRALSMAWVILGHTFQSVILANMENTLESYVWLTSGPATKITTATLAVDTFLYMAAFLLTWSVLKKFNSPVTFTKSVPFLYLSRYLRLTPALAAVMLLQISFFNHVSDGPDWRPVTLEVDLCLENWWVNLLYLQNYLRPLTTCLAPTWYLAVDMQLYLAAPILLIFLFMTVKFAIASLTVTSLASLGAALAYCFYYDFNILFGLGGDEDNLTYMDRYYVNTIPRSPPFVLGIVIAYVIFSLNNRNITLTRKPYIAFHWITTAISLALPLYGTYLTIQYDDNQVALNFFNAWHRPVWALGVGGVIVASMHGFGGPVGWFLSLDMWIIPARLSYSMYLIHFPIMYSIVGSQSSPARFSQPRVLVRFVSDLGLTVLAALCLNMVVEAPFAELRNLLFAKLAGSKEDDQNKLASKDQDDSPHSLENGKTQEKQTQGELSPSLDAMNEISIQNTVENNQFKDDDPHANFTRKF